MAADGGQGDVVPRQFSPDEGLHDPETHLFGPTRLYSLTPRAQPAVEALSSPFDQSVDGVAEFPGRRR